MIRRYALILAKILPVAAPLLALYIARALCSHNKSGREAFQNIIGNHETGNHETFAKITCKSVHGKGRDFFSGAEYGRNAEICRCDAEAF